MMVYREPDPGARGVARMVGSLTPRGMFLIALGILALLMGMSYARTPWPPENLAGPVRWLPFRVLVGLWFTTGIMCLVTVAIGLIRTAPPKAMRVTLAWAIGLQEFMWLSWAFALSLGALEASRAAGLRWASVCCTLAFGVWIIGKFIPSQEARTKPSGG